MSSPKSIILSVTNDLVTDQRVHRVALCLTEMGYSVICVGRQLPKSTPLNRPYTTKRIKLLFNQGPFFYACYNIRLFFLLITSHSDIYYANDLDSLLANYLASKLRRKPLIYDSHEYFTEVPELINRPKIKRIWERLEHWIVPSLTHCITVSPSIAKVYKSKYGVKFRLLRNMPLEKPAPQQHINYQLIDKLGISSGENIIIYQGALNVGRGLELAIKAMQHLDNTKLLIVGGGDIEVDLIHLSQNLNLDHKVIFTGRIPAEELHQYTQIADIGISLEEDLGLNYRYALPNKLFDYIHAQTPVLVSPLPDMGALVKQYNVGELLIKRSPEDLANQLRKMLSNKKKLEMWQAQCAIAKKELNWNKEKKVLENLVRSI